MQNKGNSIVWLLPVIVILTVVMVFGAQFLQKQIHEKEWENINTDLLKIQGKAKIIFEKYHVNNENELIGEKQDAESLEQYNVKPEDVYYKWTDETLQTVEMTEIKIPNGECYFVNYGSEEVIYSKGYKASNGITYYKLSEIKELGENK